MLSIQKQIEEKISEMEPSSIFSISDVAGHIADKYGWSIVPTGDACLNYLGLSTQMPAHYEYISDGPYRKYEVLGFTINFKHTTNKEVKNLSYKSAVVVQAIKTIGKENIDEKVLVKIRDCLSNDEQQNLLNECRKVTSWVFECIKKLWRYGMIKFLNNELEDINEIIRLVAMRKSLPETIIEKDMWVYYLLDYLFNRCQYRDYFEFKSGTSLSKGYGVISRFSEDVDIVVNAAAFIDVDIKDVLKLPSKTQKQKKTEEINELAISFYKDKLIPIMQDDISKEINKDITVSIFEEEKAIILHQEANRKEGKLPSRYSRHYYDLYKMFSTVIKEDALKDRKLLDEVREL